MMFAANLDALYDFAYIRYISLGLSTLTSRCAISSHIELELAQTNTYLFDEYKISSIVATKVLVLPVPETVSFLYFIFEI